MAIREDLVSSAVTFLQDPSVAGSPIENRVAFLQSKNLTQEEVDAALARAGGESAPAPANFSNYAPQQQVQPPPPEVPQRDWRDWFIMATVMGGVGYGLYFVAKRYVYPIIAPPTEPQLQQDKQAIDEQFEKAFGLLDQLSKDTEELKTSEKTRTERLDVALTEVETVIGELKSASRRREDESRRMGDEVRGLKDLIPKAMEAQKETTDTRLKDLNTELKSLKTLMGQRMNPPGSGSATSGSNYGRASGAPTSNPTTTTTASPSSSANGGSTGESVTPKPASVSNGTGTESVASLQGRSGTPFNTGAPAGRAAIPSWQLAAGNKSSSSVNTTTTGTGSGSQEASGAA
ncbi:Peroxisomal membrane protein PER10 [Lachnellula arida]|uniref:Peroxisomal membrane protein PEX14 n=1 Tax=Lachnellula arida TaxID=1316785 RepID=A0A8T9BJY8_9HELO|nr:Peroxisomal membrane protein PER10 [Lachnellula arida]